MPEPTNASINVDVLILGSGVQGLWLLNDLIRAGYSALLIERDSIGGDQTLHSHGFIHQGIGYPHCHHLSDFQRAAEHWRRFVSASEDLVSHTSAHVGFVGLANSLLWEDHWQKARLSYKVEEIPKQFCGSTLRKLYRTDEFAVHLVRLIERLCEPVREFIVHGEVKQIRAVNGQVTDMTAAIGARSFRIHPQSVVLAAGEGNAQLISQIDGLDHSTPAHHLRKSHVVVVRGQSLLEPINLLIPDIWLFVVSQTGDDGHPVWLLTSDVDKAYDGQSGPDADAIQRTVAKLRCFDPALFSRTNVSKMEWGAYVGLKVEPDSNPDGPPPLQWCIKSFGLANLFAVWPTKLTFAPLASADVVSQLERSGLSRKLVNQSAFADLQGKPLVFRQEKWRSVEWQNWIDFRDGYGIHD